MIPHSRHEICRLTCQFARSSISYDIAYRPNTSQVAITAEYNTYWLHYHRRLSLIIRNVIQIKQNSIPLCRQTRLQTALLSKCPFRCWCTIHLQISTQLRMRCKGSRPQTPTLISTDSIRKLITAMVEMCTITIHCL